MVSGNSRAFVVATADSGWGSRNFRERFFESCAPWCLGGHVLKLLCESFAKVAALECKSLKGKLLGSGTKVVASLRDGTSAFELLAR